MPMLIRDIRLIDGNGGPTLPRTSVIVDNGKIAWIGPCDSAPAFAETGIVEGAGRSLLPGLINSHVHLCSDGSSDFAGLMAEDSLPMATLRAAKMAATALAAGITSVRDCGARDGVVVETAKAIEDGLLDGPRITAAGRVITMTGGHGRFMGREADGEDGARRAVRDEIRCGADFIKVVATGGVLTHGVDPANPSLSREELAVVVREAHNSGRRVTAHAIGTAGIANALLAGVDSIEHGMGLDDPTLELAIDRGAFLVPTLLAVHSIVEAGVGRGVPGWAVAKAERWVDQGRESFVAAVKSGLKIAAGTDAGTPFNLHDDLPRELARMVEYGLSPMDAVVAATRNAAENMDVLHRVGTVEVGKYADLILVDGNPDEDVAAVTKVVCVWKGGVVQLDRRGEASPATGADAEQSMGSAADGGNGGVHGSEQQSARSTPICRC